jgi:hypothetical protein
MELKPEGRTVLVFGVEPLMQILHNSSTYKTMPMSLATLHFRYILLDL